MCGVFDLFVIFFLFIICCRKIFIGGLARETTDGKLFL